MDQAATQDPLQDPTGANAPKDPAAQAQIGKLPRDPKKGAITGLPIPRYVTLKGGEGNARRGPGLTHRIDWVFTTSGTPLRITAEYENWRRVEDFEGMGGWIHFTLLSGVRGIIVTKDMAEFHVLPDAASPVAFQAEAGALAKIMTCSVDWCRVKADGEKGWALKADFWGVDPDEVIE
jgi:SH3-like domain-containing protein